MKNDGKKSKNRFSNPMRNFFFLKISCFDVLMSTSFSEIFSFIALCTKKFRKNRSKIYDFLKILYSNFARVWRQFSKKYMNFSMPWVFELILSGQLAYMFYMICSYLERQKLVYCETLALFLQRVPQLNICFSPSEIWSFFWKKKNRKNQKFQKQFFQSVSNILKCVCSKF